MHGARWKLIFTTCGLLKAHHSGLCLLQVPWISDASEVNFIHPALKLGSDQAWSLWMKGTELWSRVEGIQVQMEVNAWWLDFLGSIYYGVFVWGIFGLDGGLSHQRRLLGELSVMELPFSMSKWTKGWGRTLHLWAVYQFPHPGNCWENVDLVGRAFAELLTGGGASEEY